MFHLCQFFLFYCRNNIINAIYAFGKAEGRDSIRSKVLGREGVWGRGEGTLLKKGFPLPSPEPPPLIPQNSLAGGEAARRGRWMGMGKVRQIFMGKALSEYVAVSSPQHGENTAFFSSFPLGGLHS